MNRRSLKHQLLHLLRRHAQRRGALADVLAKTAQLYLDAWHNLDYDMARNGELALLRRLSPLRPRVVFDVGANHGDWLVAARECFSDAELHAFEIAPATFEKLAQRATGPGIQLNDLGLSDRAGPIELRYYPGNDGVSTILEKPGIHDDAYQLVEARTTTGEQYCAERGIDRIDLLKIDTEGAEPRVLRGFGAMLDEGRIGVIQFEYGLANVYGGMLLRDLYRLLEERGYAVGKLYPDGVRFRAYHPRDEDFRGPNYVAVSSTLPEWVRALG